MENYDKSHPFQLTDYEWFSPLDQVNTTRSLLQLAEPYELEETDNWFDLFILSDELATWLWENTTELFGDAEDPGHVSFQCLRTLALGGSYYYSHGPHFNSIRKLLLQAASPRNESCLAFLKSPDFLHAMFQHAKSEEDSFVAGELVIEVLSELNVNIEDYKAGIFKIYPEGLGFFEHWPCYNRRLLIEHT